MSSSWIGWSLGTGLWSADRGLITLSILMEDTQVDKIPRKNMENEKRAEKKLLEGGRKEKRDRFETIVIIE